MFSDLLYAVIPFYTVWGLSRSRVERALISILMGSCLVATGCGIAKIYFMVIYDFKTLDGMWAMIPEFFWCRMEEAIIIIAACAPLLKSPIERLMKRFDLPTFKVRERELATIRTIQLQSDDNTESWSKNGSDRKLSDPEQGDISKTTSQQTLPREA